MRPLLNRILSDFAGDAAEKEINLKLISSDLSAYTDIALLEQIIRNYVANAVRYTVKCHITLNCSLQDSNIIISVVDTGIGIPTDQLDAIFGAFYQLTNPNRDRSKGLGLGLAIVKRISSLLEHKIEVSSTIGEGSSFSVQVPLGLDSQSIEIPKSSQVWLQNYSSVKTNIVVIDDDFDVRESTAALFLSWGSNVCTGATAQEALEMLARENIVAGAPVSGRLT